MSPRLASPARPPGGALSSQRSRGGAPSSLLSRRSIPEQAAPARSPLTGWTGGHHWAAKAATVLLWTLLLSGPLALAADVLALSAARPAPPPAAPPVVDRTSDLATAGEFAQRLVVTWLTSTRGSEEKLAALLGGGRAISLPDKAYPARDPATQSVRFVDGVWSVTVAVTVEETAGVGTRRFYLVPVLVDASGVSALALPAPVSGPVVAAAPTTGYPAPVPLSGPVATTVLQFLQAYLTGAAEVTRYVAPDAPAVITAVAPAPYTQVRLLALHADQRLETVPPPQARDQVRVLVTAAVTGGAKQTLDVEYALTLQSRAGRWEVYALDPTPALPGGTPAPVATPSALPSPRSEKPTP